MLRTQTSNGGIHEFIEKPYHPRDTIAYCCGIYNPYFGIFLSYFSLNMSIASLYLAFSLSILLINIILGIFSVNSSDFSVPTCIGFVASITITAAAQALKDEITSPQKSN